MTLKVTQGHWKWRSLIIDISFFVLFFVVCSKNVSILQCFGDVTTFAVYMPAYDLQKSCNFNKTVETTSRMHCALSDSCVNTL